MREKCSDDRLDSFLFALTIAERCRNIDEQFKSLEKGSSQSKKQSGPIYLLFKIVAELNRIIPQRTKVTTRCFPIFGKNFVDEDAIQMWIYEQ